MPTHRSGDDGARVATFLSLINVDDDADDVSDRVKEVVCFGEGAGANILTRFAVSIMSMLCTDTLHRIGVRANFSRGEGAEPSLPKKYFDRTLKQLLM